MTTQLLPAPKRRCLPCVLTREEFDQHSQAWILDNKLRQLSPATLSSRRLVLDKMLWFLEKEGLDSIDVPQIKAFLVYVSTGHESEEGRWGNERNHTKARPSTVLMYFARLRTFYAYLVEEEILERSPFEVIKPPICREDQIQPFTQEQINALLHAAAHSACPKRNRAIILFMLDTGVRAAELCSLKMGDIDMAGQKAIVTGKGNKRRSVYFGRNTAKALQMCQKADPHAPDEALFFAWGETKSRRPLSRTGLTQLIQRLGKAAKIEATRSSPHTLRHTFAVEFLRNGGNTFSLQTLLGHTSLAMTRRYASLAQADIEKQHRQFSPADSLKGK